jgi:hypothetical protein
MKVNGVTITDKLTLSVLLRRKELYDMENAARVMGRSKVYLRRLCKARRIGHHRFLGRYYMTPKNIADLLQPVAAVK